MTNGRIAYSLLAACALAVTAGCSSEKAAEPKMGGEGNQNLKRAGDDGAPKSKPSVAAPVEMK